MLGELFNNPFAFLIWAISLVTAITIHEFSHALAADRLGDPTPRVQGRLTLNPLAHLDLFGTIMMLIARFGWGKPVVFDPFNLRHPRRDAAIISFAGPVSNLLLASFLSVVLRLLLTTQGAMLSYIIIQPVIVMNVFLAIFNLVPIHPLDGFKIVEGLLPREHAKQWHELEPYGMIFLLLMVFPLFGGTAPVSQVIMPVIQFILGFLLPGTGSTGVV